MLAELVLLVVLLLRPAPAAPPTPPFGTAVRNVTVSQGEVTVFAHSVSASGNSGEVRTIFVESGELLWPQYDLMRLRVYVDADPAHAPSIDVPMGFFDEGDMSPWGTAELGNTGFTGAEVLRFVVPFNTSVRIALQQGQGDILPHSVHVLVTGTEIAGPAARRTVTQAVARSAQPGTTVALFNSSALPEAFSDLTPLLLGLSVQAANTSFYAGAVRACWGGASLTCFPISYGLESFFLAEIGLGYSKYVTPFAGITSKSPLGNHIIAWRAFDEWHVGQLQLLWDIPAGAGEVQVLSTTWLSAAP